MAPSDTAVTDFAAVLLQLYRLAKHAAVLCSTVSCCVLPVPCSAVPGPYCLVASPCCSMLLVLELGKPGGGVVCLLVAPCGRCAMLFCCGKIYYMSACCVLRCL
jgi:hypothetical protein